MDLKIFKIKHNLTTKELADTLGIKPSYLSSIMSGYHIPSSSLISRIVNFTRGEVKPNTFFSKKINRWKSKKTKKENAHQISSAKNNTEDELDDFIDRSEMED
jgi:transcriptional regulator with XRE-family HTH domain